MSNGRLFGNALGKKLPASIYFGCSRGQDVELTGYEKGVEQIMGIDDSRTVAFLRPGSGDDALW